MLFEAENGVLHGVVVDSTTTGYSGTGYVGGFDQADDYVEMTVTVPAYGLYDLSIGYSAPYGSKNTQLFLNGNSLGEVALQQSSGFAEAPAGKVVLNAGANTIRLVNDWGWYFIDYVKIQPATKRPPHQVTKELVNTDASKETKSLFSYLVDQYRNHILSGQADYSDLAWINDQIGKKPAIIGFDLMDYSPSRVERGASSHEIENALEWDRLGGIATVYWHWNAPAGLIDQPGKEWWRGFYADATTFDIAQAMGNPDSQEYKLLVRDIDTIAVQLKKLQDAKIPVLFRPLHEAEGGWFWWGAKGPEPAKKLYRLMYDRLTHYHHINNLIWVWNSKSPDWYPGDDVVDIISVDSYSQAGDYNPVSGSYDSLVNLVSDKKLVALAENGPIPDPDLLKVYEAYWSWFMTWGATSLPMASKTA
ncbi:hypothetical protein LJK87_01250 [Paenibacillus sp. P25]|nr:hypothetical protein LJK87_01250 [Paenibacillus sp. P25]